MKIINKKVLQDIALNYSADVDCLDFIKIYRECTKQPYNILTIDTKLPASDPLRFRKIYLILIKITVTDQIKILNKKFLQNEAQYDLDRKHAKISAHSSKNLDKYEYLTPEDLDLKPSTVEQAKFEYSPQGLSEDDKKEGLFKILKSIENKIKSENKKELEPIENEEQSEVLKDELTVVDKKSKETVLIKDKLDFIFNNFDQNFNSTRKKFLKKLAKDEKKIDYNNLFFEIGDKSVVKSADFLKEFGTLYDLLIYLLDNSMRIVTSTKDQIKFFKI